MSDQVAIFLGAIAVVVAFLMALLVWVMFRCKHAWELVDKTELPSGLENIAKSGASPSSVFISDIPSLSKKTIILALRCPKCGAARIYKESA